MTSSNINLRVDLKMKCFVQLARKCIVDNIEAEIDKTDNEEMRQALVTKLTEVLENDLIFTKPKNIVVSLQHIRTPTEPVSVRNTPLKLKNMSNSLVYKRFCASVASLLGCNVDYSDTTFGNLPKNARVYEGIKRLYSSGRLDQESLDQLVSDAENMTNYEVSQVTEE